MGLLQDFGYDTSLGNTVGLLCSKHCGEKLQPLQVGLQLKFSIISYHSIKLLLLIVVLKLLRDEAARHIVIINNSKLCAI